MLVMLTFWGFACGTRAQSLPADAHDACVLGVRFRHKAQLMLMMLVFGGSPATQGFKAPQLMLMMLAFWGFASGTRPS